eukprot:Opistho-2@85479
MDAAEEFVEQEADISDLPNFRQYSTDFDLQYQASYYDQPHGGQGAHHSHQVPDVVRNFILYFHQCIYNQRVQEINSIYENSWNRLTERYYENGPWPSVQTVAPLVDNDRLFLTLYKELYYRHIYSKLQPSLEQRIESFENYCDLFEYIIKSPRGPVALELPNQWLWDIIDEFIYQFQSWCMYRSKLKNKSEDEMRFLKENKVIWDVHSVLNILHSLVNTSKINEQLEAYHAGRDPLAVAGEFGASPLYKMLGYFSIIGLCRLHCLFGDYHQALKIMGNIDLNKRGLYARVPACQITTYYYVGFAYLMLRRYQDAVRLFANILLFIQRTKQFHTKSYQYEQMMKRNEQMYALLAIAVTLCPQRIDDNVHQQLREKKLEKMLKMQRGDEATFEELFNSACPKFLQPVPPDYDGPRLNFGQEAYKLQVKLFLSEVRQQALLPTIRSYLKLYTTMPTIKLAEFLDMDDEQFRTHLLCYKHKTRNLVWAEGAPLSGSYGTSSDVDFFVDRDMIHISDAKVPRRYGEYFVRQIQKFEDIIRPKHK